MAPSFRPALGKPELLQVHVPFSPFNYFVHVKGVSPPHEFGKDNVSFLSIAGVHARQLFV
jgi:hypothetical protein